MRVTNSFGLRLHIYNNWYYFFNHYDFLYNYNKYFIIELFLLLKFKKIFNKNFFSILIKNKKKKKLIKNKEHTKLIKNKEHTKFGSIIRNFFKTSAFSKTNYF